MLFSLSFSCREASAVWNTSSKLGLVPDSLVQDLFHQINLNPTKEQSKLSSLAKIDINRQNLSEKSMNF
jgi:hypothetical protein